MGRRHTRFIGRLRSWAREQRLVDARAARWEERRRKAAEKRDLAARQQRYELHIQRQHQQAVKQTIRVEQRVQKLTTVLQASLADEVGPLDFEAMKTPVKVPALDLGADASPEPAPQWKDFAPSPRDVVTHLGWSSERRRQALADAKLAYEQALHDHRVREEARLQRVAATTSRHDEAHASAHAQALRKNREVDLFRHLVFDRDRHAVSKYFQQVLDGLSDPPGFPHDRRAGYAPESSTLTVEWVLPAAAVIPREKEYRYLEDQDETIVHKWRSPAEIRQIYHDMTAQVALRVVNTVFGSDPAGVVEVIVFNGVVEEVGQVTGRRIRPCVLTLRAPRSAFKRLKLHGISDPVETVRKHFGARLSDHPEELAEVPALLPFTLADPAVIELAGDVAADDPRPDLLSFSVDELIRFLAQLLDRMGLDTRRFATAGPSGVQCVAIDPTPVTGGKIAVHACVTTKAVPPATLRALHGLTNRESAIRGMLLTTGGFHPSSYGFVRGKRIELYDGHSFLALCHQHGLPARIGHVANVCPPQTGPQGVRVPQQRAQPDTRFTTGIS